MKLFITFLLLVSNQLFAASITPFSLPWMNNPMNMPGMMFDMSDYPGGIFVLEAYFLGCPYCNENAPQIDALAEHYQSDARVHVIDLGRDTADSDYTQWIARHDPNHPVVKDAKRVVVGQLGTTGYPSTYVVDCRGTIVAQTSGEWGSAEKAKIMAGVDHLLDVGCDGPVK